MQRLTDIQAKILGALAAQVTDGQVDFQALAKQFKTRRQTVREHIEAIARKGHIELSSRGPGRSPVVKLLSSGVPVVGHIAAGLLSEALEYPEGYLRLPTYPGKFGLRVQGDSMADAIQDGDIVLLHKRAFRSGEVCAVRVDKSEATLKYLDLYVNHPETVLLRPHNPAYPTLEVEADRVVVDGVFFGLLRGDVISDLLQEIGDMN